LVQAIEEDLVVEATGVDEAVAAAIMIVDGVEEEDTSMTGIDSTNEAALMTEEEAVLAQAGVVAVMTEMIETESTDTQWKRTGSRPEIRATTTVRI
jgi:hypothetical protein